MRLFFTFLILIGSGYSFSQSYTSYLTGSSSDVVTSPEGGVCLMGGASEHDEAMKWFLNRVDGGDVLVLRASGSDGYNDYMYSDLGVTLNSVETIVCNSSACATETYIHDAINEAEAIWFAGGDQWTYISYWRNTAIDSLINKGIQERNMVIGGTSAGMAIQGHYYFSAENGTVTSGTALSNPYDPNVTVDDEPFLINSFLEDIITDTHYDSPDRKGRHTTFLARILVDNGEVGKGIACDEYTAVCIDEFGLAKVFGDPDFDDIAYFIQPNCDLPDMTPEDCSDGNPLEWNHGGEALKVYKVFGTNDGSNTFDLSNWKTGSGGEWEHWWVESGSFMETPGSAPICSTGLKESKNSISFYPNPAVNAVWLDGIPPNSSVRILDQQGKVVLSSQSAVLDVSGLSSGVYVMVIANSKMMERHSLIIK